MPFFPQPPEPEALGVHRVLSPKAGVLVSPLCLGTMNFGGEWFVDFVLYQDIHSY